MRAQLEARLQELQKDFDIGEKRLRDLDAETVHLRETLLRISGAIQVVQELLAPEVARNGAAHGADEGLSVVASPHSNSGADG